MVFGFLALAVDHALHHLEGFGGLISSGTSPADHSPVTVTNESQGKMLKILKAEKSNRPESFLHIPKCILSLLLLLAQFLFVALQAQTIEVAVTVVEGLLLHDEPKEVGEIKEYVNAIQWCTFPTLSSQQGSSLSRVSVERIVNDLVQCYPDRTSRYGTASWFVHPHTRVEDDPSRGGSHSKSAMSETPKPWDSVFWAKLGQE
ncbi:hypothetical protein Cgig2_002023 [Carnegiea gigantea]|uniref:Uncharacterized protein n=1 Tax=Carnegiea gigantea TaxID=171969 RepID=A0A9Q1GNP3_9CARY|nr:hypothetical protein Cgig2_002023 [Carnegiea gigantea]